MQTSSTKQVGARRSTVESPPLQLELPGISISPATVTATFIFETAICTMLIKLKGKNLLGEGDFVLVLN